MTLDEQLLDPQFLQDPYPTYDLLRETDPVYWFEPWRCWILTRHADISDVLRRDGKQFTVVGRVKRALEVLPEDTRCEFAPIAEHFSTGLLHSDPPEHTRLRTSISRALTPRTVVEMRPNIEKVAESLLEDALAEGDTDLVNGFAFHLPAIVVATLIGFPIDRRHDGKRWADAVTAFFGANTLTLEIARNGQNNLMDARKLLQEVIDDRTACPAEDIISRIVSARDDGDRPTSAQIISTAMTFLVGGHETTTALITSGLLSLFRFPDQMDLLRSDLSRMSGAVEEFLRFEGPNQRIKRIAKVDTRVGDKDISAGDEVMLLLGAGNRDPEAFPNPHVLDITRKATRHLSFATGPHLCIGAPLARLEAEIALSALLTRCPALTLLDFSPEWIGSPTLRILKSLQVRL